MVTGSGLPGVARRLAAAELADTGDDRPLEFSGTPGALRGHVDLRNSQPRQVLLSRIDALTASVTGDAGVAGVRAARVARATVLPADGTRRVPVTLGVDRHTPPGRYEVDLEVAGRQRRAVLTVLEDLAMGLEPTTLVVGNRPGVAQEKLVVVRNGGNVPLQLADIGAVPLDDERLDCRALRGALREWSGRPDATVEGFVVEVGRQAHQALDRAGILRVHVADAPLEVPPGEQRTLTLSIEVPSTLDRHTRYYGFAPVYLADLTFVVVPAGAAGDDQPPPAERPRPRATRSTRSRGGSAR